MKTRILIYCFYIYLGLLFGGFSLGGQEKIERRITLPPHQQLSFNNFHLVTSQFRPKIGVALSGGGLRGLAQIGVLKVFEEQNIPIDYIAGTSIGCIIGGLYSIGYTADEIDELTQKIKWTEIFLDTPDRQVMFLEQKDDFPKPLFQIRMDGLNAYIPQSVSQGQKLSMLLNELILRGRFNPHNSFDDFEIPFRGVATDLKTGEKVVIDRGDLGQVMMGSSAVPPLFPPVTFGDKFLVDGGLVDNIPTDVIKNMGADIVIAVNTVSPLRTEEQLSLPWDQADQMINIMQRSVNQDLLKLADIVIRPDLSNRLPYDLNNLQDVISKGKTAAQAVVDEIKQKINNYKLDAYDSESFLCASVKIEGNKHLSEKSVENLIIAKEGEEISERDVVRDLRKLYRSGFFSHVEANFVRDKKLVDITYIVDENPVIKSIEIQGNNIIPDSAIFSVMDLHSSQLMNSSILEADIQNILKIYRAQDYSLADLRSCYYDTESGILTIEIHEGRIDEISVVGNKRTKDFIVMRNFPLKKGDVFNLSKAKEGISNIFSTGLFNRAYLSFYINNPLSGVQINLEEKKYLLLKFGAHYDYENKTSGFVEIQDDNLMGINTKTSLLALYGSRHQLYQYRLRQDRVWTSFFTFKFNFHYKKDLYYLNYTDDDVGSYSDRRIGGFFSIGQQLYKFGTLSAEARIEKVKITPFVYPEYAPLEDILEENIDLRTITLSSIVDTQDKFPFPENGKYHHLYYETAGRLLGGKLSYVKIYSSFESYYTYEGKHTVHPRIAAGVADETLPFSQRYKLGGDKTLFGYRENELAGRAFLSGSLEYRYKTRMFKYFDTYLSMRYDFGNTWAKNQSIQLSDMIHAFGGALALNLPFGPLEVSYGRTSAGLNRIYVSLGHRY